MANQKQKQPPASIHPANKHLKPEVAARYEVIDWPTDSPAQVFGPFGLVDLRKLSLQQATNLVSRKFPKLKAKREGPAAKSE